MPKAKIETITIGKSKIKMKKDALRNMLSIPEGKNIPVSLLQKIMKADVGDKIRNQFTNKDMTVTTLMKRRASLARTLKKMD